MRKTHTLSMGIVCWALGGFLGLHRFYYDSRKIAWLYFFTLGLLGVGWVADLFFLKKLQAQMEKKRYKQGSANYSLAWILFIFLGILGIHKLYLQKKMTCFAYFFTFGFLGFGLLKDLGTLNKQVEECNRQIKETNKKKLSSGT